GSARTRAQKLGAAASASDVRARCTGRRSRANLYRTRSGRRVRSAGTSQPARQTMNLNSVLSIGTNGLNAATHGTQVASQNISNAATPGYTRREANFEQTELGVKANGTTRINDQFLEKRNLGAKGYSGEADARVKTLAVLDTVFADGQGGVGEALDAFD